MEKDQKMGNKFSLLQEYDWELEQLLFILVSKVLWNIILAVLSSGTCVKLLEITVIF